MSCSRTRMPGHSRCLGGSGTPTRVSVDEGGQFAGGLKEPYASSDGVQSVCPPGRGVVWNNSCPIRSLLTYFC